MRHFITLPARKPRTLRAMREYLKDHPRRKGWIGDNDDGLGICHNVKIRNLHLTHAEQDACYRLLDEEGCYYLSGVRDVLYGFERRNPGYIMYQAGRNAGYFVLHYHVKDGWGGPVWADAEDGDLDESKTVRELAGVVWDFDKTCNEAVAAFVEYAVTTEGEEEPA